MIFPESKGMSWSRRRPCALRCKAPISRAQAEGLCHRMVSTTGRRWLVMPQNSPFRSHRANHVSLADFIALDKLAPAGVTTLARFERSGTEMLGRGRHQSWRYAQCG
jgi:hypothetical protein